MAVTAALYGRSAIRIARRRRRLGTEERLVFVVGSPRSGTTFTARALGSLPGFVDLDEVQPWKAAIPGLMGRPESEVATRLRRILERVRLLGLAAASAASSRRRRRASCSPPRCAYPEAVAVHVIRDGRDIVTSLLERGWLSAERTGTDDALLPFGSYSRFWVEPGREHEFSQVSDATRAAWAWRRYVTAAEAVPERTVRVRYEQLVTDPAAAAAPVAARLGVDAGLVTAAFAEAHDTSAGRWRRDLTPAQLTDAEREAGAELVALGYELSAERRPT